MQSFIITSKDPKKRNDYAIKLCDYRQIAEFDRTVIEQDTSDAKKIKSIGIEQVRNILRSIYLKPLHGLLKAIIVKDCDSITTEAQNALLKILEEPPEDTIIILTATSKETFLPTILSRCKIIELKDTEKVMYNQGVCNALFIDSISEKLKIAQNYGKNNQDAREFIEKLTLDLREKVMADIAKNDSSSVTECLNCLKELQKTYKILKTTNVNPRLALEHLLLSIN